MKERWKKLLVLVLSAFFMLSSSNAMEEMNIPEPKPMKNVLIDDPNETMPGMWYVGATPKKINDKPPLVFVHGIHGSAKDWWQSTRYHGKNDMYQTAYKNGYQTAFVQLYDPVRGALGQIDNGKVLTRQLEKIVQHFGKKVTVVAHSKGGVDAQAAMVHWDAHRFADRVIMIGVPNQGTQLADLAFSWYMGWLSELLEFQDDGTFDLQIGNMEAYRKATDSHPNIKKNTYYTISGTNWGPYSSALWLGGLYLSQFGENDGLINEESTRLPYAKHLATLNEDHDSVRKAACLFPYLDKSVYSVKSFLSSFFSKKAFSKQQREQYLHGGELLSQKEYEKSIYLDPSIKEAVFSIMTKSKDVDVTLESPTGKVYTKESSTYFVSQGMDIFKDAVIQSYRMPSPEKGEWKVRLKSREKDAYMLTVSYKGKSTYSIDLPSRSVKTEIPLRIQLLDSKAYQSSDMIVNMKIVRPGHDGLETQSFDSSIKPTKIKGYYTGKIQGISQSGLYNVTIELNGRTNEGFPYQRSVIRSIYIGNPER